MRILIFTTAFYPSIGGIEKQTSLLTREFIKRNHEVRVIVEPLDKKIVHSGLEVHDGISVYTKPGQLTMFRLFRWCSTLYMPNISLKGWPFLFLKPFRNWVVSHNDFYLANWGTLKTVMKKALITLVDTNVSVSQSVADYIPTRSTIIFNCYDNSCFKIYNEGPRLYDFVFLGRLVTQKGCDLLISACAELTGPFRLNIIGDGPELKNLQQMVIDLGLQDKIKFVGSLEGITLAKMLNRHRTMIIPSIGEEGFGIVALEGLACGCNVIAAEAGGLKEAVGTHGKTFPMRDLNALKTLLQTDLDNKDKTLSGIIDNELQKYLIEHTGEAIATKYLTLFK